MTKIMLVEDDKSLREIYGVRLLAEGYEIISAGDGEEALAMAVKEKPGLILSDVMMPKISGFDMLDILRSTPETKDIKVIMMTALSSEDQRTRGEKLGANRYLVKSQVGIEDVVRTVHDVLADVPVSVNSSSQKFGVPVQTAAINTQTSATSQTTPLAPPVPMPTSAIDQSVEQSTPQTTTETKPLETTPGMAEPTTTEPMTSIANETIAPSPTAPLAEETVTVTPISETTVKTEPPAPAVDTTSTQLPQPTAPFSTSASQPIPMNNPFNNTTTPPANLEPTTPQRPPADLPPTDMNTIIDQGLHDGSETNPTAIQ